MQVCDEPNVTLDIEIYSVAYKLEVTMTDSKITITDSKIYAPEQFQKLGTRCEQV